MGRIWRAHGLKPHRVRSFKLSNDPQFAEKLEEIVGLYLNPPEHALVLSLDEKSQIQALDRTQPGLPLKKGQGQTMTHDYKRHGTTTLFAALNTLNGRVIGTCMSQHRHQEWLRFLRLIASENLELKGTARLLSTVLRRHLVFRACLLAVGGVVMPLLIASRSDLTGPSNGLLIAASLALAIGGEILGRYLFFVSVVPRQMAAAYLPAAREAA